MLTHPNGQCTTLRTFPPKPHCGIDPAGNPLHISTPAVVSFKGFEILSLIVYVLKHSIAIFKMKKSHEHNVPIVKSIASGASKNFH